MNLILLKKYRQVNDVKKEAGMNVGDYLYVGVEGGSIGKADKEDDEGGML